MCVRCDRSATPSSVLATLRRLRSLVAALVLVMTAGPAGAVCAHALAEASGDAHGEMEMVADVGHAPAEETPPCHGEPEPPTHEAPASHGDTHHCASACCASPATPADETALAPTAPSDAVPAPTVAVVDAPAEVPAPAPVAQPPPPPLRVHVELQRFLI